VTRAPEVIGPDWGRNGAASMAAETGRPFVLISFLTRGLILRGVEPLAAEPSATR
jgi:hypothetical protein